MTCRERLLTWARRLGFVAIVLSVAFGSAKGAGRPRPTTLRVHNAYGDTAWLQNGEVHLGPLPYGIPDPRSAPKLYKSVTPYARTRGTPILICLPASEEPRPAMDVVKEILPRERLGLQHAVGADDAVYCMESGSFDHDILGGRLHGWEPRWPDADERRMRLIFAVIGVTGERVGSPLREPGEEAWAAARSEHDPLPLRSHLRRRPFEIPVEDRLATARIVGEFEVDLKRMRVKPTRSKER